MKRFLFISNNCSMCICIECLFVIKEIKFT